MRGRLWVVAFMALAAAAVWAPPALAHAGSETNSPADGSIYRSSSPPKSVTVHFFGIGRLKLGIVQVYDQRGRLVSAGTRLEDDASTVVSWMPKLDAGNYVVAWRVTVADAHSVHGAFAFSVRSQKRKVHNFGRNTAASVKLSTNDHKGTVFPVAVVLAVIALAATTSLVVRRRRAI